jgi:hypothetical protein
MKGHKKPSMTQKQALLEIKKAEGQVGNIRFALEDVAEEWHHSQELRDAIESLDAACTSIHTAYREVERA